MGRTSVVRFHSAPSVWSSSVSSSMVSSAGAVTISSLMRSYPLALSVGIPDSLGDCHRGCVLDVAAVNYPFRPSSDMADSCLTIRTFSRGS